MPLILDVLLRKKTWLVDPDRNQAKETVFLVLPVSTYRHNNTPACPRVFGTMIPSVAHFLGMDWNHLPAIHENRWDTPDWCRLIMIWCTIGSMGMTEKSDGAMCSSAFNPAWTCWDQPPEDIEPVLESWQINEVVSNCFALTGDFFQPQVDGAETEFQQLLLPRIQASLE